MPIGFCDLFEAILLRILSGPAGIEHPAVHDNIYP